MGEDPMQTTYYLSPAVERAMKIQEVILRAIAGGFNFNSGIIRS